jgi:hypothetical protein
MEVAEFDDYSYMFSNPIFVVLDPDPTDPDQPATLSPTSINVNIQGMRIGVNGKLASVGQVFLNINKDIIMTDLLDANNPRYVKLIDDVTDTVMIDGVTVSNVPESSTGTIIPKQRGPNGDSPDQFYLAFESFDGNAGAVSDPGSPIPLNYTYADPDPDLPNTNYVAGVRMFEEINATMSELTGVAITNSAVQPVFTEIQQQLPSGPALAGFLASNQIAAAKLSLAYCGELVDNTTLRDNFFGTLNMATVFDAAADRDNIVNNLYDKFVIDNVASQPSRAEVSNLLIGAGGLLEQLSASCSGSCDATRNATILKSMCVSVLSSASATVQ